MIIKPCTQGEINFYESALTHPSFQDFMPTFMGSLSLNSNQQHLALSPDQNGAGSFSSLSNGTTHLSPASASTSPSISAADPSPLSPDMSAHILAQIGPSINTIWTPSGGRKLDTGLSIVLENITDGFQRPNILDLKLGARLWADDAPPAKKTKLDSVAQETTSASLGFRIAGMKVWKGQLSQSGKTATSPLHIDTPITKADFQDRDGYRCYDKFYGRRFTSDDVKHGIEEFLNFAKHGKEDRSRLLAKRMARKLRRIKRALEHEESRMYSASILIVYEGDPEALDVALEDERRREEEESTRAKAMPNGASNGNGIHHDLEQETSPGGSVVDVVSLDLANVEELAGEDVDDEEEEEEEEEEVPKVLDIRLIDFAHASWTPGQGPDENALHGVRSVLKILNDIAGS